MPVRQWTSAFRHLLFPTYCVVCGSRLRDEERGICLPCDLGMPRTHFHRQTGNPVEKAFWGKCPLVRGTSFFYYYRGDTFPRVLFHLKYHNRPDLGIVMGQLMARELQPDGFFEGIDVLVPVPLHPRKQAARGYNQSERLARGISLITGIPVESSLLARVRYTETQTRKSMSARFDNLQQVFELRQPLLFEGKHVLLIDDVLTTGATLTGCADCFASVPRVRLSVLSLAVAGI